MSKLILETKVKDGRKVRLFVAKDGRHYIQCVSYIPGENICFEWLPREDYISEWKKALTTFWEVAFQSPLFLSKDD
jgi:hypothetical protein